MTLRKSQRLAASGLQVGSKELAAKKNNTGRKRNTAKAVATLAAAASSLPDVSQGLTVSPYFSGSGNDSPVRKSKLAAKSPPRVVTPDGKPPVGRTASFEPLWAGKFPELADENIQVHTLILGTHPSIKSLSEDEYYGHAQNAFWWIVGDCLGFRRASGISPSSGKPYKFSSALRYGMENVVPYEEQVRILASRGFAIWDVIGSCQREGSLDSAIKNEVPNDVRGFCERHPSVKRIVLANGGTGSQYFAKHNKDWWKSGQLKPGPNKESQSAFRKFAKAANNLNNANITCISAVSVSPAAATYSYEQKREFWEQHVYTPGLEDFEAYQSEGNAKGR